MDEGALASWRRPRSSIAVACQLVRRGQAAAVVSAGSTGGIVATARLRLRPLPGMLRPALAVVLPTRPEPTLLLDAGAIADPKPEMLLQFAQLGVAYAQIAHGIAEPRVGLLTIGAEPGKGNKLARRAYELLDAAAAARRAADQLRRQRRGRRPAGRQGRRDRDRRLHGERGAEDARGHRSASPPGSCARRCSGSRAARLGALLQRRGAARAAPRGWTPRPTAGPRCSGLEGTVVIAHGAASRPRRHVGLRAGRGPGPGPDHREDQGAARAQRGGHFLRRN